MPIAAVAAAAITAGSTIYASSQQSKAAKQGMDAQQAATNQSLALQQQQFQQVQQNLTPYMQGGYAGLDALLGEFGLAPMTSTGQAVNQGPQYDVAAYLQANPDVAAARSSLEAQGVIGPGRQWESFEDWVASEQIPNAIARGENRTYPQTQATTPTPNAQDGQPLTFDQQIAALGERPNPTRPDYLTAQYVDAPNPDDYFTDYEQSPSYQFLQDEARRAVNVGAFSRGIGASGGTQKALQDRAASIAGLDYGNWWNRQNALYQAARGDTQFANNYNLTSTQQQNALRQGGFESDRLYGNANFDADRNYLTNQRQQNVNNLFGLIGIGQNAAAGVGNAGQNYANNSGNLLTSNANALAAGYAQQADARASGVNALAGLAGGYLSTLGANNRSSLTMPQTISAVPQFMAAPTNVSGFIPAGMPQVSF